MPTEFDDGDAVDTDSQGRLVFGATAIPGTAKALIVNASGQLEIDIAANAIGLATEAKQDDQETTLNAIQTSVEIIDDAVVAEGSTASKKVAVGFHNSGLTTLIVPDCESGNLATMNNAREGLVGTNRMYGWDANSASNLWERLHTDGSNNLSVWHGKVYSHETQTVSSTGVTELLAAPGASIKLVLKSIIVHNNDNVDGYMALQTDGQTKEIVGDYLLQTNGGEFKHTWSGEGRRLTTANEGLEIDLTTIDDVEVIMEYTTVNV